MSGGLSKDGVRAWCADVDEVRISVGVSGQVEGPCNEVAARVRRPSYYDTGASIASLQVQPARAVGGGMAPRLPSRQPDRNMFPRIFIAVHTPWQ